MSAAVLENMKLVKKSDVVASRLPISIRCTNPDYLKDYLVITKMDNPKVIRLYIEQEFKEGVVIRFKELPNKPTDVFHHSKKRKLATSISQKGCSEAL